MWRQLQLLQGPVEQPGMCDEPAEGQQGGSAAGLGQGQLGHEARWAAPG